MFGNEVLRSLNRVVSIQMVSKNMFTIILMERVRSGVLETRCHHNLGTNNTSPGLRMIRVADAFEALGYFSLKLLGDMLGFIQLNRLLNKSSSLQGSF